MAAVVLIREALYRNGFFSRPVSCTGTGSWAVAFTLTGRGALDKNGFRASILCLSGSRRGGMIPNLVKVCLGVAMTVLA